MHYFNLFCLSTLIGSFFSSFAYSEVSCQERLKNFPILSEVLYREVGYHNCDMHTNGELTVIKNTIQPGDVAFDIGANVGEWSANLIHIQPKVTIYAFEPIPLLVDIFRANFCAYPNVLLSPLALSNKKEERVFTYYPELPCLSTLYQRFEVEKQLGLHPIFFKVNTERLDTFCKNNGIQHINFVKIDTEGSEWDVLFGAEELLKSQSIDIIQFEYGGCYLDSKTTLKQIYDYLTAYQYAIYRISSDGLIEIQTWCPELENFVYSNYLAVKKAT